MAPRIVIMAGGTGGHIFPALAVADRLRARGAEVIWMGTRQGLEATLVPSAGYPVEWITISGLRGKGIVSGMIAPFQLLVAFSQSWLALSRWKPAAILGLGGFVSGPGGIGAWLQGCPLLIHEQNAIAGTANRWLARLACRVMEGFPGAFAEAIAAEYTGNPVRAALESLPGPSLRLPKRSGRLRLLVLGGSQGARVLNETLPPTLALLAPSIRPEVWHQCGARQWENAAAAYQTAGLTACLTPFIEDMAGAYGWADLVLCRAGALTISELMAAGVGSLLVPFPFAIDNHQRANARFLVEAGAARLLPEHQLTPRRLAQELEPLGANRRALLAMAQAARWLHPAGAARRVAGYCWEAADG